MVGAHLLSGTFTSWTRIQEVVTTVGEAGDRARESTWVCVMGYRSKLWGACLYSLPRSEVCFMDKWSHWRVWAECDRWGGWGPWGLLQNTRDCYSSQCLSGVPQSIRTEDFAGHRVRPILKVDHSGVTSKFQSDNTKLLQNSKDLWVENKGPCGELFVSEEWIWEKMLPSLTPCVLLRHESELWFVYLSEIIVSP